MKFFKIVALAILQILYGINMIIHLLQKKEIHRLLDQLEQELDIKNYFRADHKKKVMMRNLTNFFSKSNATSQEIQTLRGVISYLVK